MEYIDLCFGLHVRSMARLFKLRLVVCFYYPSVTFCVGIETPPTHTHISWHVTLVYLNNGNR